MIPFALRMNIRKKGNKNVKLWIPIFLLWLVVFPLLIAFAPIVLILAIILLPFGKGKKVIDFYITIFNLIANMSDLKINLKSKDSTILFNFIPSKETNMDEERKKILEMLSAGKINVEEAEKLLSAVSNESKKVSGVSVKSPRYLRVIVEPGPDSENSDEVNIRVPLKLIRAGLRLTSFIPKNAQSDIKDALNEKGIDMDLNKIKSEDIDEIIKQIDDLTVDVKGKEKVRIFCE